LTRKLLMVFMSSCAASIYIAILKDLENRGAGPNMEKVCNDLGWKFFPPSNV
jgi:hypothetical protein